MDKGATTKKCTRGRSARETQCMKILDTDKVRELRTALGLTQAEAGKRAGFKGRQQWNNVETGDGNSLTLGTLAKIAGALDVEPADLLLSSGRRKRTRPS